MDYRVVASVEKKWYRKINEKRLTALVILPDGDDEEEVEIPIVFEVCDVCDGLGKYVNPSIDSHGISSEEWENDWDEEEKDNYLSGGYDVECSRCKGKRVVPSPDETRMEKELFIRVSKHIESVYTSALERANELEMGY